eukprot:1184222-Prymnesium_polylepis.1
MDFRRCLDLVAPALLAGVYDEPLLNALRVVDRDRLAAGLQVLSKEALAEGAFLGSTLTDAVARRAALLE